MRSTASLVGAISASSSAAPSPALHASAPSALASPALRSRLSLTDENFGMPPTPTNHATATTPQTRARSTVDARGSPAPFELPMTAHRSTPTRQHTEKLKLYVEPSETGELHVFAGNSNRELAAEVAAKLDMQVGRVTARRFADGECNIQVHDSVRGNDIFVLQATCPPISDNLTELVFMIAALRRASARTITAVIPYFGYSRQDVQHYDDRIESVGASDVARMLETVGVDRVITFDLHNAQIEGFFPASIPVDNLMPYVAAIPYFAKKRLVAPVIVAPSAGGVQRAKKFLDNVHAYGLEASLAFVVPNSKRDQVVPDAAPHHSAQDTLIKTDDLVLIGEVNGSDAIIVDDMIDTGSRIIQCASVLRASGARRVFAFCTHGLFSGDAVQRISASELTEVVVTNTTPVREYANKIRHLSVSGLLAECIRRIFNNESVAEVYKMPRM